MNPTDRFAVCVSNEECDDLVLLKVYRVLPDERAAEDEFLRVVDESGEDYLYPAERFVFVEIAPAGLDRLTAATR